MNPPDPITRLNKALEGRYRIESELGEGGMAMVYLADDLRHERRVALKVLKPELAAVVGAERFLAEIKTTANLQHPHILPLFDSGEADTFLFYVMPYVEGETLRDRLEREKQLPVDEAIRIAKDVAEALHSAHKQGVIHRDIKPANILLSEGRPLVADFGIALAVSAAGGGRLTETGLSMGTPYYMSPEQASADREPTPASDVYSLGCVLFEMLTGDPPHTASSAQAVLAKILTEEARAPTSVRSTIPPGVDAAVRKALEKLPADRFAGADAFGRALSDEAFRYGDEPGVVAASALARPPLAVTLGLVGVTAVAALVAGWAFGGRVSPSPPRVLTTELTLGPNAPTHNILKARISDDGSVIVYLTADGRGTWSLFVRGADEVSARQIPNTEGAHNFAISPSSEEVAFTGVAVGPLRVVSTSGEVARTVVERAQGPPVWGRTHVYFTDPEFGLARVALAGGDAERLTPLTDEVVFRIPSDLLPQEDALLFTEGARGDPRRAVFLLSLQTGEITYVTEGGFARYLDGLLIYSGPTGSQIMGAPFDLETRQLSGGAVALLSGLAANRVSFSGADFSVGAAGDLVYQAAGPSSRTRTKPVWVDRAGTASPIDPEWYLFPAVAITGVDLSHDGTRFAAGSLSEDAQIDVGIKDLRGGPAQRMSFDPPTNTRPFWGPNDDELYYFRDPDGGFIKGDMLAIPSDGSGRPREVLTDVGIGSGSWGAGHEWMIYRVGVPARESRDIYGLQSEGSEPVQLVATAATEQAPSLSPDGRWLLYQSDRSGDHNVFVRPFPNVDDGLVQISLTGGTEPQWATSGNEIFYRDAIGQLVSARVEAGAALRVTAREVLFDALPYWSDPAAPQYDVAPDDERFIMLEREPGSTSLVVVWSWLDGVKARLVRSP